ncbi:MAG: ribosomal L7Ae/L30e/S12e/Gadd45 family protein [Nitrososphaeraceae archaeon]
MKVLNKVIKDLVTPGKYKCGLKEVLPSVKGSKLLILSKSVPLLARSEIEAKSRDSMVPIYYYEGNSVQLGKLCNKPFRVSIIALKTGTEEDISMILSAQQNQKSLGQAGGKATRH